MSSSKNRRRTGCPARGSRTTKCTSSSSIATRSPKLPPQPRRGSANAAPVASKAQSRCHRRRPERSWRTRDDPLAKVWEAEVVPLLRVDAQLNAVTLLEELQRRYPGDYDEGVLRTLQRRMRQWRATHGAEREVYFAQEHPPARLGLSDFTVADDLAVEVEWPRSSAIVSTSSRSRTQVGAMPWLSLEAESFIALSAGLQGALWHLGGVPEEHRTDSLSAAFNNLAEEAGSDQAVRGLVPSLRHACQSMQPGSVPRERLDRVNATTR